MRWDVFAWAVFALVLFALEVMAPGAFMLWLAFAASAVLVIVWAVPGLSFLLQAVLFVVLGVVSILIYRKWFRGMHAALPPAPQPSGSPQHLAIFTLASIPTPRCLRCAKATIGQ